MVKKNLGKFFLIFEKNPKNGKQVAKIFETIKKKKIK
jgi:hypothetical protein